MKPKFNIHPRNGTYYAEDRDLGARTWADVGRLIDKDYVGATKERFQKFLRSAPAKNILDLRLAETCSGHFSAVLSHSKAGVSTNVHLRILQDRALEVEWLLRPVLSKRFWPKIEYGHRKGITRAQHEAILQVTPNAEYRLFFELLWHTGGSQSDIAALTSEDIDWDSCRLYYPRKNLKDRDQGNACLVIDEELERVLKKLPSSGSLFPHLRILNESRRSNYFWARRVKAKVPDGIVLYSYRRAWAERAYARGMPEREVMAHLGHRSKFFHRAFARNADQVTMPVE